MHSGEKHIDDKGKDICSHGDIGEQLLAYICDNERMPDFFHFSFSVFFFSRRGQPNCLCKKCHNSVSNHRTHFLLVSFDTY